MSSDSRGCPIGVSWRSPLMVANRIGTTLTPVTTSPASSTIRPVITPADGNATTTPSTAWPSASSNVRPGPFGRLTPYAVST